MATLGTLLAPDLMTPGSCWQLHTAVNGYSGPTGLSLTTQAFRGRGFRILDQREERLEVELLEDGYRCWLDKRGVIGKAEQRGPWQPTLLAESEIAKRIPDNRIEVHGSDDLSLVHTHGSQDDALYHGRAGLVGPYDLPIKFSGGQQFL